MMIAKRLRRRNKLLNQFLAKLSEKEKKIFYITVLFLAFALMDRLFFGPIMDKLKTIAQTITEQEDSIKADLRLLFFKNKIVKSSEVFSKYFSSAQKDDDVINAEFLSKVEKFATQSNVNLIKSNPSESKKEKNFIQYFANLDCAGQLKDVISFMYFINSADDLFKITRFNMTPKRGSEGEVNASMTIVKMIVNPNVFVEETTTRAPKKKAKK